MAALGENNIVKTNNKMEYKTQVQAALTAGLLAFSVGSNVALSSSLIPLLLKENIIVHNFQQASMLATVFLVIAIPTSILGGICSDKIGRRRTAMLSCIPLVAGWIVLATATSYPVLLIGRCLCSAAVWSGYPSATVLVSESVHSEVRGTLSVFPAILLSVGMFTSYLLGYILESWRVICWVLLAQPLLTVTAMLTIKESPYWLVQNNRKEEALQSLRWYRGPDYDVSQEFDELLSKKAEENKVGDLKSKLGIVFSRPFLRGVSCTGVAFFFAQFNGISALVMFMVSIFQDAKLSVDPRLAPVFVGAIRIIFSCISSIALRKGNRKYIFCFSTFTICVCTLALAIIFTYRSGNTEYDWILGLLPLPIVMTMFIVHSFGINPVIHLISSEVFPTSVRSIGNGTTLCLATFGNTIQSTLFPYVLSWFGISGCFFWFSGFALFVCMYGLLVIPDNRGLSLVTIEKEMLGEKKLQPEEV